MIYQFMSSILRSRTGFGMSSNCSEDSSSETTSSDCRHGVYSYNLDVSITSCSSCSTSLKRDLSIA